MEKLTLNLALALHSFLCSTTIMPSIADDELPAVFVKEGEEATIILKWTDTDIDSASINFVIKYKVHVSVSSWTTVSG